MDRLFYLYIVAGVFGAGVIIIDFFSSVLTSIEDGGDDADAVDSKTDDSDFSIDEDGEHYDADGSNLVDYHKHKARGLLQFIAFLRTLVYFCAGFGITGIFALLTGESSLSSLLWSVFMGLGTVGIFKIFRKIQRNKLDSSFSDRELLNMKGEALLPMSGDSMGKVRIHFGSTTVERYAKSASKETSIKKGAPIVISNVDRDVVYVRNLN